MTLEQKQMLVASLRSYGWTDLSRADRYEELLYGITPLVDATDAELEDELAPCPVQELRDEARDLWGEEAPEIDRLDLWCFVEREGEWEHYGSWPTAEAAKEWASTTEQFHIEWDGYDGIVEGDVGYKLTNGQKPD